MSRRTRVIIGFSISLAILGGLYSYLSRTATFREQKSYALSPKPVTDFTLLDHAGVNHFLYRYSDAKAVVLIGHGTDCPIVQKYSTTLRELNEKYAARGAVFLMINPNLADTRQRIIQDAEEFQYKIPILLDPSQIVTRELGMTRTSEVVIVEPKTWKIVYRGAIDDRLDYGADKLSSRHDYLREALDEMLEGNPGPYKTVPAKGCAFTFMDAENVSYKKDIMPILKRKCLTCHAVNGRFPPYFDSHEKIRSWIAMIRETVFNERMPPFSADTLYGDYLNDISLTPEEKHKLISWIDKGAPKDVPKDPLVSYRFANKGLKFIKNKKPVYSVSMEKEVDIPPQGVAEYPFYQLGGKIPKDFYVAGIHMQSTSPRQIHHASIMITPHPLSHYIKKARKKRRKTMDFASGPDGDVPIYILKAMRTPGFALEREVPRMQIWAAGKRQPFFIGNNRVMHLPKDHYIILETHYMGIGRWDKEQTSVDFYGTEKLNGQKVIQNLVLRTDQVDVPAGIKRHTISTPDFPISKDVFLTVAVGHMHMRGRAMRVVQRNPAGVERTVLSIPNYYFGWQTGAGLAMKDPVRIEAGSSLHAVCEYDNSAQNPFNPDPSKSVKYGQTLDRTEMCHVGLQYVQ